MENLLEVKNTEIEDLKAEVAPRTHAATLSRSRKLHCHAATSSTFTYEHTAIQSRDAS